MLLLNIQQNLSAVIHECSFNVLEMREVSFRFGLELKENHQRLGQAVEKTQKQ
jgi:hypothetical protein